MIWLLIAGLAAVILAIFWRLLGFSRAALQLTAAALLVAAAGYAWQGRPGLPGSPAQAQVKPPPAESAFAALRPMFFQRFDAAGRWLTIAESYERRGDTANAVGLIRSGLRERPNHPALWIGLGNALVLHAGGMVTPAAELAFRRAAGLAPGHPAPPFFYGLALVQGGDLDKGERVWRRLLATAPTDAPWRPLLVDWLKLIADFRAFQAAAPGGAPPQAAPAAAPQPAR